MVELNVSAEYTPSPAIGSVGEQLTAALAHLQAEIECVKSALSAVKESSDHAAAKLAAHEYAERGVHPYHRTEK